MALVIVHYHSLLLVPFYDFIDDMDISRLDTHWMDGWGWEVCCYAS